MGGPAASGRARAEEAVPISASQPRSIYLAGRHSRREELAAYAERLRELGHEVTARWLNGDHQASDEQLSDPATHELAQRYAYEDLHDLSACDLAIFFSERPRSMSSRGGRHVELGWALAYGEMDIWLVGPVENVFHTLSAVRRFASWPEALEALRG